MVRRLPPQKMRRTPTQQEKSFEELTALLTKINPEHPLYQQALPRSFCDGCSLE